jgi:cyanophycin synthetase
MMAVRGPSWNSQQVERAFRDAGASVRRRDWLRVDVEGELWFEVRSPRTTPAAVQTCKDKGRTVAALRAAGVAAPAAHRVAAADAGRAAAALGGPVCVKPAIGSRGRSVVTGITDGELLAWAVAAASRGGKDPVLVERSVEGVHWRVLVLGTAVSAVECRPWLLVGDGRSSVEELVAGENARREAQLERPLMLTLDESVVRLLAEQNLQPLSVLEPGRTARVAWSMNARQGAVTIEHGPAAPTRVRDAAEAAVAAVSGLGHGAVDLVDDGETTWVVDVNSNPGLTAHLHPYEGDPQPVLDALVGTHLAVRT